MDGVDSAFQYMLITAPTETERALTVAAGQTAPAAGPAGQVQVLITSDDAQVGGYDAVFTDPKGLVGQRLGLDSGGRVVVRPDGYIGAIAALDDAKTVADYFAKTTRWRRSRQSAKWGDASRTVPR